MAEPSATPPASGNGDNTSLSASRPKVNIRLISPSWELADFPVLANLPASTTVGQVKVRVEHELAVRQRSSLGMRMIYRGRVLDANEKTLADVFGGPSIQETDVHTLHLVLRDGGNAANTRTATTPSPNQPLRPLAGHPGNGSTPAVQPTPTTPAQNAPSAHVRAQTFFLHHPQPPQAGPQTAPVAFAANPSNAWAQNLNPHTRAALELARRQNPALDQWMRQPGPGHNAGQMAARESHPAPASVPPPTSEMTPLPSNAPGGRTNSNQVPDPVQHQQEGSGTGVEGTVAAAGTQPFDGTSQPSGTAQPGPSLIRRHNWTLPQERVLPPSGGAATSSGVSWGQQTTQGPDVYILASPTGPRALLINGSTEAFYTPSTPAGAPGPLPASGPLPYAFAPTPPQPNNQWHLDMIQQHNQQLQQNQQQAVIRQHLSHLQMLRRLRQLHIQQNPLAYPQYQQRTQQAAVQAAVQAATMAAQAAAMAAQAAPLGGQAPRQPLADAHADALRQPGQRLPNVRVVFRAAVVWPHIWLVARLCLFVWWFTSATASWTRWAMVCLFAIAVFIANVGVFDALANQVWAPFRAHLDDLLPVANAAAEQNPDDAHGPDGPNGANPRQGNDTVQVGNGTAGVAAPRESDGGPEPDPELMAARLLERRRIVNTQRLANLARRLERLGILFISSIAPGLAERHVAMVEQDRARRRMLEEQAAAEQAARAEAEEAALAEAQAAETAAGGDQEAAGEEVPVAGESLEESWRYDGQDAAEHPDEQPFFAMDEVI